MGNILLNCILIILLFESSSCFFTQPFNASVDALFILRIKNRSFAESEIVNIERKEEIANTPFDPKKPIVFQIHGYMESQFAVHHLELGKALLQNGDINLIFIDWSKGAATWDYNIARSRTLEVSKVVGEFMNFLHEKYSLDLKNVDCIGFSLGAHICGVVGSYLNGGKIGKVVGLDPAGPGYDIANETTRLSISSALYVECVHTGYYLGIRAPICQANFYANQGSHQPGCANFFGVDDKVCSHVRAIWYFIESLDNQKGFYGKKCTDMTSMIEKTCSDEPGEFMGNLNNLKNAIHGVYSFTTNHDAPFARGIV